ncbi:MAG: S9 family peptidase [Ignavibacteriae bacterium]|nr:S9 family peptidase [Ignavibacteriota bacterium]
MKHKLFAIFLFITFSISISQTINESKLTLERIFQSRDFASGRLGEIEWFENGDSYTMLELIGRNQRIVKYDVETGDTNVIVTSEKLIPQNSTKPLRIESYSFSDDLKSLLIFTNSQRVWRTNTRGDYWVLNLKNWNLKKLGGNAKPSSLMFATFSPDKKSIAYVSENNLFVENLNDGKIVQLTNDGSATIINGTFDWVYEEELSLQNGFRWSPDSKQIAYWQLDASGIGNFNMINNTDSIYSQIIPVQYPKAGTQNSACKVGVVDISNQKTKWINIPGDPRNNYIARMDWAESSSELLIQQLNRLQNHNYIYLANSKTGEAKHIYTEIDENAWVEVVDDIKWFDNGKYFTWLSDKNGWNQIYLISRDGKDVKNITNENFDVIEISGIDQKNNFVYYTASPDNPTQKYLYKKSIFGNEKSELITPIENSGTNTYNISPNYKWAIHNYSTINDPGKTEIINLPLHKIIRILQNNDAVRTNLEKLEISPVEFFTVEIDNTYSLDAFKILPPNFDENKKYPVLFYVYGEPGSQTVLDRWSRSFLWHQMLAQNGFIIISIDNRGTPSPKGKDFRKCIYKNIGVISSFDQAEAAKQILNWKFVDKEKIGIWGWSGGGSMTLNMLFRYPEIYKFGVSVAPVTDLKLYDTIYEERYMGLPSTNAEAYKNGSPITFANQLKGKLLLIHGTGDDNVHYQNSEMLINELIKHSKQFTFLPYPNRSHGIYEGENTTMHLYNAMTNFILDIK